MEQMEYVGRGDFGRPFTLAEHNQARQKAAEAEVVLRRGLRERALTYDEMKAGLPCPGCQLPLIDAEPWDFRGTMHMTPEQRARYESEQTRFGEAHPDCGISRWTISGSLTAHCFACCPPAPHAPSMLAALTRTTTPTHLTGDQMRWRLRLHCGHEVVKTAHRSWKTIDSIFRTQQCPACGADPVAVVDAETLGAVESQSASVTVAARRRVHPVPGSSTKADLQRQVSARDERIKELEAELGRAGGLGATS